MMAVAPGKKYCTVILDVDMSDALDVLADREDRSRSYLMHRAIRAHLVSEGLLPAKKVVRKKART